MGKKSVAKNSLFNLFYKGVTTVFPLITTVYVSRALLPEGVGAVTYATTVVSYFILIASLGIPNYGIKAIAQKADPVEERSKTFFELFYINLISTIICITAYYCFINTIPYYADRRLLFNIVGLQLILNILNVDWFYQGIEEYRLISIRGVTVRVISFLLIILFVHQPGDYIKYALILCLGTAGNNIYNGLLLRRYIKLGRYDLAFRQHLQPVFILLASTIATEIYTMLDTVMLEYFHGNASVGYYSNSVRIVRTVYNMTIAIATPLYPRISWFVRNNDFDNSNRLLSRGASIIYLIAAPATAGLICTSDYLVPLLFGEAFYPSSEVLKILGVLIMVFSTAYLFGHIILMAMGREGHILRATISGASVNFIINILLIPVLKQNGAAIASVCAEIVVTIVLIMHSKTYFQVTFQKSYIISEIVSVGLMVAVLMFERSVLVYNMMNTVIMVLSGVIVYGLGLLITRNEVIFQVLERIKNRVNR